MKRKGRRWPFALWIRDGQTDEIRRETLIGIKPGERWLADKRRAQRENFLNGLGEADTAPRTWADACAVLLAHVQGRRRKATVRMYRLTLERFTQYAASPAARQRGKTLYLEALSTAAVAQDYIPWRLARVDVRGRTIEASTLNKDLRIFKAAWNFWRDREFTPVNPWAKIRRQPETRRLHVRLTQEQAARLLAESGNSSLPLNSAEEKARANSGGFDAKFQAALHLALDTGMRIGELSHITWGHVDVEAKYLQIAREPCGWLPKDYEEGRLAFGLQAAMMLREIYNARIAQLTHQEDGARSGDEARELLARLPVFGKGHTPAEDLWERDFNADLKRCCARAGVPVVTAHDLRRTVARLANAAGASPEDLRTMLRHSAFATTLIYIGDDQRDGARRAFEALRRGQDEICIPRCTPPESEAEVLDEGADT